jgi:WD40 repeat protein
VYRDGRVVLELGSGSGDGFGRGQDSRLASSIGRLLTGWSADRFRMPQRDYSDLGCRDRDLAANPGWPSRSSHVRGFFTKVRRVKDGTAVQAVQGHWSSVSSVQFSPDGKILASTGYDGVIRLWRVPYLSAFRVMDARSRLVYSVAFSPDGKLLASGGWDNSIKLWLVPGGRLLCWWEAHRNLVNTVAFSLDGKVLASGSTDRSVKLWDVQDTILVRSLDEREPLPRIGVAQH